MTKLMTWLEEAKRAMKGTKFGDNFVAGMFL